MWSDEQQFYVQHKGQIEVVIEYAGEVGRIHTMKHPVCHYQIATIYWALTVYQRLCQAFICTVPSSSPRGPPK